MDFVLVKDTQMNHLMGWESSTDTLGEINLRFSSKEKAIEYAQKNGISFKIIEPKKKNLLLNHMQTIFLKINYVA